MNILHITEHMGDGVGKAIGGLARLGCNAGHTHSILVLDEPRKFNHIETCRNAGVNVTIWDKTRGSAERVITEADITVLNWWGSRVTDEFIADFPKVPCRLLLWAHKNGYFDPPLPDSLVDWCDGLLVTNPWTLENPKWREKGTLVWGFGDFRPEETEYKKDYSIGDGSVFTVGYIGYTGYKRFPANAVEYYKKALEITPQCRFVLAGETDEKFMADIEKAGLTDKVNCIGWTPEASRLLPGFDMFGYLTRDNIFGATENSVLEALASALPVALSRQPLGRTLLEEGSSGLLFDNPEEFADIIARYYNDEALRQNMGENARAFVLSERRTDENMLRYYTACEKVMKTAKGVH